MPSTPEPADYCAGGYFPRLRPFCQRCSSSFPGQKVRFSPAGLLEALIIGKRLKHRRPLHAKIAAGFLDDRFLKVKNMISNPTQRCGRTATPPLGGDLGVHVAPRVASICRDYPRGADNAREFP